MEETLGSWRNLSTIVKIESIREIKDWITRNVRYYISDEKEPKVPIMQHWHWMSPSRRTNAGLERDLHRRTFLHIVSEQKDKLSMKRRLYKAALDINYLKKLLEFDAVALNNKQNGFAPNRQYMEALLFQLKYQ